MDSLVEDNLKEKLVNLEVYVLMEADLHATESNQYVQLMEAVLHVLMEVK